MKCIHAKSIYSMQTKNSFFQSHSTSVNFHKLIKFAVKFNLGQSKDIIKDKQ